LQSLKNMGLGAGSLPFFVNGVDGLTQPPPAHMGIPPYHHLDPSKGVHGKMLSLENSTNLTPVMPFQLCKLLIVIREIGTNGF